jgi:hypothetical protein
MSPLAVALVLVAQLLDPGNPSFATYGAAVGAFVGGLVAHARRDETARDSHGAGNGALVGFGVGFACWLAALAMDRL